MKFILILGAILNLESIAFSSEIAYTHMCEISDGGKAVFSLKREKLKRKRKFIDERFKSAHVPCAVIEENRGVLVRIHEDLEDDGYPDPILLPKNQVHSLSEYIKLRFIFGSSQKVLALWPDDPSGLFVLWEATLVGMDMGSKVATVRWTFFEGQNAESEVPFSSIYHFPESINKFL